MTSNRFETLLPTGFGAKIHPDMFHQFSAEQVKWLLMKKGFIVVRDLDYGEDKLRSLINSYGSVVEYTGKKKSVGFGYKDILKLEGEKDKIVTGQGELPLHADGGLLQTRVDIVFLYAIEIAKLNFEGSTTVLDHELAHKEMPHYLRRILEEETFESRVLEKGYYVDASPEDWFEVPVFTNLDWTRKMLIYFPFTNNNPPSWETRIKGFSESETAAFFSELKAFYTKPRYYYKHYWKTGDLLITDNRRVLHAREAFGPNVVRKIYRGQTVDLNPKPTLTAEEFYKLETLMQNAQPMSQSFSRKSNSPTIEWNNIENKKEKNIESKNNKSIIKNEKLNPSLQTTLLQAPKRTFTTSVGLTHENKNITPKFPITTTDHKRNFSSHTKVSKSFIASTAKTGITLQKNPELHMARLNKVSISQTSRGSIQSLLRNRVTTSKVMISTVAAATMGSALLSKRLKRS